MPHQKHFLGYPVAPGIAVAPAVLLQHRARALEPVTIDELLLDQEIIHLSQAIEKTRNDIEKHRAKAMASFGEIVARIFDAHLMFLEDEPTFDQIRARIRDEKCSADYAVRCILGKVADNLMAQKEDVFRDRAQDVSDVCNRLVNHLSGMPTDTVIGVKNPSILVAQQLNPSDILQLDMDHIIGVATDAGGATSHTAILTRILGVPSVVGLRDITKHAVDGDLVIVNGNSGKVILRPTKTHYERYLVKEKQYRDFTASLRDIHEMPSITRDGRRIELSANIELPEEANRVRARGGEGIGLFRTEYLYLARGGMPSEEEQYKEYLRVAQTLHPERVIIRTFDLGGDKAFPGSNIPPEKNPFLGWRAIRVGLDQPEHFMLQLRAILRASALGNVNLMFPMIHDLKELMQAKELLESAKASLESEGSAFDRDISIGIMVEIPSVAIMASAFAKHVDFFSIGTNDLIQFTLAVDRDNEQVAHLYQPYHPAILELIRKTIDAGHEQGIWVGVCGEMAGDTLATLLLLGLGVDELSVSPALIPEVKKLIRSSTYEESRALAEKICSYQTAMEARDALVRFMRKRFADIPIWFGSRSA